MKTLFAIIGGTVVILWALGSLGIGDFALCYVAPNSHKTCAMPFKQVNDAS